MTYSKEKSFGGQRIFLYLWSLCSAHHSDETSAGDVFHDMQDETVRDTGSNVPTVLLNQNYAAAMKVRNNHHPQQTSRDEKRYEIKIKGHQGLNQGGIKDIVTPTRYNIIRTKCLSRVVQSKDCTVTIPTTGHTRVTSLLSKKAYKALLSRS